MSDPRPGRTSAAVCWGLLAAWAVHDAEELLTMPGWADRSRARLRQRLPFVPDTVWDRAVTGRAHAAIAIGTVGLVVAAAAADGARTGGRSELFQAALAGFGAHAVPHLAGAVVTGGYTPGLVTTPTVVVPYALWARRRLRRDGVPDAGLPSAALLAIPVVIGGAQAVASLVLRSAGSSTAQHHR